MPDNKPLLSLIGEIYDAALVPDLWRGVLERTCAFLNGVSAAIYGHNVLARTGLFYFSWGDNPDYTKLYFEEYIKISPLVPHFMAAKVGEVYCASRMMPYEELRASRFYKEWCLPQQYVDFVATTLERSVASVVTISVGRSESQGLADDIMQQGMMLIAPHFRRAIAIGKAIDMQKIEAAAFVETLDRLSAAVFLVDSDGRLIHASASGRAMLSEGGCLRSMNGVLAPAEPQPAKSLHEVFSASRGGDANVGSRGVALPLASATGDRYVAHVLPLTSGTRRDAESSRATVAVFVRKAEFDLVTPIEVVAERYRLTPSEVRVLHAIVEAGGVPAVALVLGISQATVKTHLHRLFEKTGTRRQSDLFKLLAEHTNPFGG